MQHLFLFVDSPTVDENGVEGSYTFDENWVFIKDTLRK
jgi:hypothetical protein